MEYIGHNLYPHNNIDLWIKSLSIQGLLKSIGRLAGIVSMLEIRSFRKRKNKAKITKGFFGKELESNFRVLIFSPSKGIVNLDIGIRDYVIQAEKINLKLK